jgi:hypothetical protein
MSPEGMKNPIQIRQHISSLWLFVCGFIMNHLVRFVNYYLKRDVEFIWVCYRGIFIRPDLINPAISGSPRFPHMR